MKADEGRERRKKARAQAHAPKRRWENMGTPSTVGRSENGGGGADQSMLGAEREGRRRPEPKPRPPREDGKIWEERAPWGGPSTMERPENHGERPEHHGEAREPRGKPENMGKVPAITSTSTRKMPPMSLYPTWTFLHHVPMSFSPGGLARACTRLPRGSHGAWCMAKTKLAGTIALTSPKITAKTGPSNSPCSSAEPGSRFANSQLATS